MADPALDESSVNVSLPAIAAVPLNVTVLSVPTTEIDRIHSIADECTAARESAETSATTATQKAEEAANSATSIQNTLEAVTEQAQASREAANEAHLSEVATDDSESKTLASEQRVKEYADTVASNTESTTNALSAAQQVANESEASALISTNKASVATTASEEAAESLKKTSQQAEIASAAHLLAIQEANTATTKAQEALESANASEVSNQSAKKAFDQAQIEEKKAYNHAAFANTKAQEVNDIKVEVTQLNQQAQSSADHATKMASNAELSEKKADDKAKQAQKYRVGAIEASELSEKWADAPRGEEIEPAKFSARHWAGVAEKYAGPAVNTLVWRGQWDASKGAPPTPTPETPDFYKIMVEGDINGVHYEHGDSIIWDIAANSWFRLTGVERPISDDLDLDSSVTSASSKSVMLLENKKSDNHDHPYRPDDWVPSWEDVEGKPDTATRFQAWDELTGKPSTFPPDKHDHPVSEVTGLQAELDSKADNHSHPYKPDTWVPEWDDVTSKPETATRWPTLGEVTGKPSTYPPDDHGHAISEVTGLQSALDGKSDVHTHPYRLETWNPTWDNVTGKPDTAVRWPAFSEVTGKPTTYPPDSHTHPYRPDTWVPAWGDVTGKPASFPSATHDHPISEVTGLQAALDAKESTVAADRKRKITISSAAPSGGADGDIWFKY